MKALHFMHVRPKCFFVAFTNDLPGALQFSRGISKDSFEVDEHLVGMIIGKGGENIKDMQEKTKSHFVVSCNQRAQRDCVTKLVHCKFINQEGINWISKWIHLVQVMVQSVSGIYRGAKSILRETKLGRPAQSSSTARRRKSRRCSAVYINGIRIRLSVHAIFKCHIM